jgi:2,4'-dihydroxyacetophenone dioxygenase
MINYIPGFFCGTLILLELVPSVSSFSARFPRGVPSGHTDRTRQSSLTVVLLGATVTDADATDFQSYPQGQPGTQPEHHEGLSEIYVSQVLPPKGSIDEELLWVPQTDTVSFRPLCLCVSAGYYVNLLRVKGAGMLSRHRHPGPVHGHVLKGRWRYLEHDWIATEGSYVFEPPGEIHTLVVPEGVEEMITLFHVTGSLLYCDPDGKVVGADDVFTKLDLAKKHYEKVGLGADFVQQFVR